MTVPVILKRKNAPSDLQKELQKLFEEPKLDHASLVPIACDLALLPDLKKLVENAEAELCDEVHPHSKIAGQKNKSDSFEKRGRGRPPTHGLSQRPIYRSHREAKRRCTDPKCPDYERYGGRGIEFRIDSVADLYDAIGDRPPNTTLDRIDPNGHYEVGNVRWASPKEQANNRCRPPGDTRHKDLGWTQIEGAREAYLQTARHWLLSVKGLSDPTSLSPGERDFVAERHAATGLPDVSFSEDSDKSYVYPGPYQESITLPALNHPSSRVVLRCNCFWQTPNSSISGRGLLEGLIDAPLDVNRTRGEIAVLNRFLSDFKSRRGPPGLRFCGSRDEGKLMAMACRLVNYGFNVRVLLCAEIADHLSQGNIEFLLQDEYLFIPDLQIWPAVFGCDEQLTEQLFFSLGRRTERWLPTIVYLPDLWGGPATPWGLFFSWWYRSSQNQ